MGILLQIQTNKPIYINFLIHTMKIESDFDREEFV